MDFFRINLCIRYSKSRQEATEVEVTIIAPIPK
jgi:hypothetical protein